MSKTLFFLFCGLCASLVLCEEIPQKGGAEQHPDSQHSPGRKTSLYGGDIKFTQKQGENMKKYGNPYGPQSRAASNVDSERWPNAVIPYVFDCSVANMESAVSATLQAMRMWESKTCIRFVERTTEKAYLELFRGQGCWGHVGHHDSKTQISIGDNCDFQHVMEHELGHTVGFWHEQSRPDRDNYISVIWENVLDGLASAFEKRKWNTEVVDFGVPYDFASIMHYPFTAFSKNGKPTIRNIVDMQGKTPYIVLSDGDAKQTNAMYKCKVVMAKRAIDGFSSFRQAPRVQNRSNQCIDQAGSGQCAEYKKSGLCKEHADNMMYWCPVTCDMCSSDSCFDKNGNCPMWAKWGHCQSSPGYMIPNCPHSCKACGGSTQPPTAPPTTNPPSPPPTTAAPPSSTGSPPPPTGSPAPSLGTGLRCADKSAKCSDWAASGACSKSGWVFRNCLISCKGKCDKQPIQPTGACATPLGLGWDYQLPDSAFSASSEMSPGGGWVAGASNARLYFEDDHNQKRIGGWCASSRNPQWIKVDLGRVKQITGIATQGRDVFYEHVKNYELEFSTDGVSWQPYEENGASKVFDGNCDHFTPVINRFNPVRAQFVKVLPHDNPQGWMCMRLELYGCDS